ncbi:conserved hypothetical protein [Ricinus communis]|uniref:Glycine-rich protein n=1 Tax=Ricinus communis TaxID=3988 RepID=B9S2D8_RICCO|nr:conserved hypothetical protein [Ricinus communis]|eukprot:XP_002520157.1 uncharacterized protein LOC8287036 [Ricinus communis]
MAATSSSEATEGPVLNLINKRLRALRKKYNRIIQMEESISQGKPINKEQEDVLRSKPYVTASIEELEKLKQPLSVAVSEEIDLAIQRQQQQSSSSDRTTNEANGDSNGGGLAIEDLLNLLYFGSLFDVKSQNEFTATMLTRTHERGCCLTYDYVTDDATDLLGERDLDMISKLGALLISRPVDSSLSHKNALVKCIEHAKLWLSNSDQFIDPIANVSYSGLRERLNKIMASDYFITTPEMKAPVEVAAAAAAGNYASFQVPVHGVGPISVPVQVEGSDEHYEENEDTGNFQGHESGDDQSNPAEEFHKDDPETVVPAEEVSGEKEQEKPLEVDNIQKEVDPKEQQYFARRNYQNQRGGRGGNGGGRRGYSNGRGGRSSGRGGGGYQNGRNQFYDQSGNYYQRNYYNNRGRGGGRGGGHPYNNHGSAVHGGHGPAGVGVAS